jgi:hypothetical protein
VCVSSESLSTLFAHTILTRFATNTGATAAATSATTGNGGASGLSYGAHCSVASAIGFLFLGGGTMRFATDAASVASLWLATYPRFPQNASDNRCHLQAFRHLYALASRRYVLTNPNPTTDGWYLSVGRTYLDFARLFGPITLTVC